MVCMTLDGADLTQSSVIWIIYCNVGPKCFFIYLNVSISLVFSYIYIFTRQCKDAFTV